MYLIDQVIAPTTFLVIGNANYWGDCCAQDAYLYLPTSDLNVAAAAGRLANSGIPRICTDIEELFVSTNHERPLLEGKKTNHPIES